MSPNPEKKETVEAIEKLSNPMDPHSSRINGMSNEEFRNVEKRLKRKLDIRLTAMIVFIYILNYLDRVCFPGSAELEHTDADS